MTSDLLLRGKWTFHVGDRRQVFIKKSNEKSSHVLMKAFLWALYIPIYPELTVEVFVGDRYKPDVVALDETGRPIYWGESGQVGKRKAQSLLKRYKSTHFAFAKWATSFTATRSTFQSIVHSCHRNAPVDVMIFPENSPERFIDDTGMIQVHFDDLEWARIEPA